MSTGQSVLSVSVSQWISSVTLGSQGICKSLFHWIDRNRDCQFLLNFIPCVYDLVLLFLNFHTLQT